ncbi:GGDEF domain-containing protein [Natronospira bacteriovora]|uniref:diguanylate cyclase n=1 Tax=Natronospira bacteriovora TaxID=3069753 RepID=A0ABU0W9T9_9GAMM|nr:GGDEF domain-containing protein [Natronospira sp. AB-CW4]MDQ2070804.1 ABC transporter substrate-binding protein [Natronospira sp. AB-CW4]
MIHSTFKEALINSLAPAAKWILSPARRGRINKSFPESIALILLVLLLGFLPFGVVTADTDVRLQLRWKHQFQFAGYYMALEKGFYEEAGLAVELLEGGPHALKPVEDMLDGKVDFAISNSGVLIERMEGKPVVALAAIAQTSPIVWIVRADSGIFTPLDLAGRRLMLMPPPESAELLAMLRQEGIRLEEMDLVPTTYSLDDLIQGEVDAYDGYSSNEPWLLAEKGVDYRLIRPRDYGINFYNDVLITRESLLESDPLMVADFVNASLRGWVYALENVEETVDHIQTHYAPEKAREHLLFEAEALRELIMPELVSMGHMNPGRWQMIGDYYVKMGMAPGPVVLDGFLFDAETAQPDYAWLMRWTAGGVMALLLLGILTLRYARLNRRLIEEGERRKAVEVTLMRKQEELYRLANTDALTGIGNRHSFEALANSELRRSQRYGFPVSMLFLDLDHFKEINDEHGHTAGDEALRRISRVIAESLRESDHFCRWGGEEFLVLGPHSDATAAMELAGKIRCRVKQEGIAYSPPLTVSIGVASGGPGDSLDSLLGRADRALYEAKNAGRNCARYVADD